VQAAFGDLDSALLLVTDLRLPASGTPAHRRGAGWTISLAPLSMLGVV